MITAAHISSQLGAAKSAGLLPYFRQSARRYDLPVAILLAVASRETGMGTSGYYLANQYTGADGHGKGIMQIDDRYHAFARMSDAANNQANINYGTQYLSDLKQQFGTIKDALSAYNAGPGAVQQAYMQGLDPDSYTTGGNYAADVLQRAALISEQGGFSLLTSASAVIPCVLALSAAGGYLYYHYYKP